MIVLTKKTFKCLVKKFIKKSIEKKDLSGSQTSSSKRTKPKVVKRIHDQKITYKISMNSFNK